jgi:hypothetical protein
VSALCTSFPLDPRRIARSRAARVLVCVLALVLVATNGMAAAMPLVDAATHGGNGANVVAPHESHAHCASHDRSASHPSHAQHPGHGAGCPCCEDACACMHACVGLVLAMPPALALPSARVFAFAPPGDGASVEAPLLRPPIA